jgi:hypothetical protein
VAQPQWRCGQLSSWNLGIFVLCHPNHYLCTGFAKRNRENNAPSFKFPLYSLQCSSPPSFADKMALAEYLTPEVSAFDVLGFTDAELIEFMQQSRRPGDGGGFDLDIDGWDTLVGDQKEKFAERLRYWLPIFGRLSTRTNGWTGSGRERRSKAHPPVPLISTKSRQDCSK